MELGLLHGFAAGPFTWRRLIPLLDPTHRAVSLERPWASRDEQVAATIDQLDRHGLEHPVLIGHSAGAEIAILAARAHPDRVRALVLIAPVVGRGAPAMARLLAALPGSKLVGPPLLRLGSKWFGTALRSTVANRRSITAEVVRGYRDPLLEPGVMEALWGMSREPSATEEQVDITRLQQPALVITGRADRWTNISPTPSIEWVELDRCGHLPQEEQPHQTAAAINRFLRGLEG